MQDFYHPRYWYHRQKLLETRAQALGRAEALPYCCECSKVCVGTQGAHYGLIKEYVDIDIDIDMSRYRYRYMACLKNIA